MALLKDAKTVTADGKHFELAANISTQRQLKVSMPCRPSRHRVLVWILKTSQQKATYEAYKAVKE